MKKYQVMSFILGAILGYILISMFVSGKILETPYKLINGIAFSLAWGLGVHEILAFLIPTVALVLSMGLMGWLSLKLVSKACRKNER